MSTFSIVPYQKAYAHEISQLFHLSIQQIADSFYSKAQKDAWSSAPRSSYYWHKRLSRSKAWLMIDTDDNVNTQPRCCGFINVETVFSSRGYIDSLYIHPDFQHQGLGVALVRHLQDWALAERYSKLHVDASHLSKGLFLSQGFRLHHRSYQEKSGKVIMGFLMSKTL